MKCVDPFTTHGQAYGCGQCLPCRINRRRIWQHRILLESALYSENAFATLTYATEELTVTASGLATLHPRDLQLFLKKLRKKIEPGRLRFFAVGEYGDRSWRPHYHAGLFNVPSCARGATRRDERGRVAWFSCCPACRLVGDAWGLGDIELRGLGRESAGYLAGYVTKKMTRRDDDRLRGRHPEFSRQSLRPGLGYGALRELARVLQQYEIEQAEGGDVPTRLRHGKSVMPLGRYLRRKLRLALGLDEKAPDHVVQKLWETEMLPLLQVAKTSKTMVSLREVLAAQNEGYAAQIAARLEIYKKREL